MPRRPATTIVLITRHDLARADFTSGSSPTLAGFWTQPRPDLPDQAALVEAGLTLGPKPGRTVWVLSSDLWTQTLALPASRTIGLADKDLANVLNFEAEAMSGQSAFESTVAQVLQPSTGMEKTYWLIQVRSSDLEMAEDTVRNFGCRLAGFAHPAGVPLPMMVLDKSEKAWRRAELWSDTVVCLQGQAQGPPTVHVVNSAPQLGKWKADWELLRKTGGEGAHEEVLVDVGVAAPAGQQDFVRLEDEPALRGWLTAWARALAGKTLAVPALRPARRPLSAGQRKVAAFALAALAGVLCFAHYSLVDAGLKETQQQLKAALEPGQILAKLDKQAKELEAKGLKEKAKQEIVAAQLGLFQIQRERLARLMACLSEQRPEHLFIEKIDNAAGEPRLYGFCVDPHLADQFASKLALVLPPAGWAAEAPKKKSGGLGLCTFTIQFRVAGVPGTESRLTAGKGDNKLRP